MVEQVLITVLAENTAGRPAFWIEADGRRLLFDTGQGLVLEHNARQLGIDPGTADCVILSHGHYDHTGGLAGLAGRFRNADLYVHPDAFKPKFARRDDGTGQSASARIADMDEAASGFAKVVPTASPTRVADGLWVTGEIPRRNDFEDTGGPFYLDEACTIKDPLLDDQALYIESAKGLVVVLGCTHAGLVNTLEYVASLVGRDRIHAVLGGMHLLRASQERIARSIEALRRHEVALVGPAHCTGLRAVATIMTTWPDRFVHLTAGSSFAI